MGRHHVIKKQHSNQLYGYTPPQAFVTNSTKQLF